MYVWYHYYGLHIYYGLLYALSTNYGVGSADCRRHAFLGAELNYGNGDKWNATPHSRTVKAPRPRDFPSFCT